MAKTQFLDYTIYLTDAALVAELQAAPHAGGAVGRTIIPPTQAATTYSAPIQEQSATFAAPCIRSEWFTTGNNFPRDQRTFERCNGGWFGICFLFGTRINFYWRGKFEYSPALTAVPPTGGVTKVAMALRRWNDGAELVAVGEGGAGNMQNRACRAASRHLQGFGYDIESVTEERSHTFNESNAALPTTSKGWERFYIRIRRYPTAKQRIWRTSGATSATAGVELGVDPSGHLVITNIDSGGGEIAVQTIPQAVPLGVWKKIDVLYAYRSTVKGTAAAFSLYVNGINVYENTAYAAVTGLVGLAQDQLYAGSFLGSGSISNNAIAIQFDDWIGAEWPTGTSLTPSMVGTLPGEDWNHGSRIALLKAKAFGSDNAASWAAAGGYQVLTQRNVQTAVAPARLDNATAAARLCVLTDADREIDQEPGQLGLASMTIAIFSFETAGVSGSLGYRLPGAAAVMAAVTQDNANYVWRRVYYQPSMNDPIHPCAGLEILFDSGAVTSEHVQFIGAAAEMIGVFGQEDLTPTAQQDTITPSASINDARQDVDYITRVKAKCQENGIVLTGACGAYEIVKRAAWGLRDSGCGTLQKTTGNNCSGHAVDQLCWPSGRIVDILGDAGGANTPTFTEGTAVDPSRYEVPVNPGDDGGLSGVPQHLGIHNAPYMRSQWARRGSPPFSPVGIVTGTYVGNGVAANAVKEITFRFPVHFLIIRNISAQSSTYWFSSSQGGHLDGQLEIKSMSPALVEIDPAFPVGPPAEDAQEQQTIVRIVGNDADSNANGITYQYTAFCDPAMRFLECGAFDIHTGVNDAVTKLNNEGFTPDAAFFMQEQRAGGATVGLGFKGVGHAAGNASILNAAEAALLAYAKGTITSKSALHNTSYHQVSYAVFRKNDGSGDAGLPRVLATTSYVGDAAGSRTVGLLMGGRRPAWAIVVPHNAAAVLRDVSHTGTNSLTFPATNNAATGITGGGIDSISVGSALNANGITYDVFVLPGDTVAGNAGWSINGEFIPVAPDSPTGGDVAGGGLWDATPPDPELSPDEPTGDTGDTTSPTLPDGQTGSDYSAGCIAETTFVINQALSLIGISKQIGDITTELSNEATTCRLHYLDDVKATLRQFPWAFATRYARLVLVAGTSSVPVNNDWQYSYREPSDSVFSRRITNPNQIRRAFDPTPIDFRIGADATGKLIYANQSPTDDQGLAPLLEYTALTTCAATEGDSIFRRALAWRHAASIAPALSKDEKKSQYCMAMFERVVVQAEVASANENQMDPEGDADWITGRA